MEVKKIFCSLIFLLVTVLSAQAEEVTPYSGSRIFWDLSTRTTVFNTGWYSRIIRLQDGRLMAAAENGGIEIAYSSNNGLTWTSPQKIVTNVNNINNCVPDLIQLTDGTIVVGYNPRPNTPYTEDRKFGIRCKRSLDNGVTWSDEIFVYDASYTFDNGCWEPSFLELPSGELQLYYSDEGVYLDSNDQNISVCRSFDKGLTWSAPDIVSYRSGSRDGMPKAVILDDNATIAVSIEDNGWPGVGDFFPTIVRCPLSENWHGNYVDGNSANRNKSLDLSICPNATGGAPYICKLPSGEIVMSYQSSYGNNNGNLNMYVAVGNKEARNFKSLQHPFVIGDDDKVMWNSVLVIDTGVVVAVGGVNSSIEMIKGYPVSSLLAPYAHPTVNGVYSRNKGYFRPAANQITLGVQTGCRIISDFAYDDDSLYFFARAVDQTKQAITGSYGDGIYLYLDALDRSAKLPLTGEYRILFRRDSTYAFSVGDDTKKRWVVKDSTSIHYAITDNGKAYVVEAAIPWKDLGFDNAPVGQKMRANVRLQNNQSGVSTIVYESIPDITVNASWTWMELNLVDKTSDDIKGVTMPDGNSVSIRADGNGNFTVSANCNLRKVSVYRPDGLMVGNQQVSGNGCSLHAPVGNIAIVKCDFADGSSLTRKILMSAQ